MTETFNPPRLPSIGTGRKVTFKVNEDEFGDGYTQATPIGLNTKNREVPVMWNSLSASDAKLITDFLDDHLGATHFIWTFPGESVASKWRCKTYENPPLRGGRVKVSATFKQVFNL